VRFSESIEGDREVLPELQHLGFSVFPDIRAQSRVDDPHSVGGHASSSAHFGETQLLTARDNDDGPTRGLRKQLNERVDTVWQPQPGTNTATQRHFYDRLRKSTIGDVMSGSDHAVARRCDEDFPENPFALQVNLRR
jgi:hypothetical protein